MKKITLVLITLAFVAGMAVAEDVVISVSGTASVEWGFGGQLIDNTGNFLDAELASGDFFSDGDEINNASDPLDSLSWPNFADGDIAPLGSPDGQINAADYLIAQRIALGELTVTSLELAHGDLYPPGSPDGVINTSDLILLLKLIQ